MISKLVLVSALAAGMTTVGMAQATPDAPGTPAPTAPAPAASAPGTAAPAGAPASMPPPQAVAARIAIISLIDAAAATNEGQKAVADVQKKYEPQRVKLDALKTDIDALTKQLQNAPATMSDEEKATRARNIDTKQKQLQRDADDAQTSYGTDVQDAIQKVEQKLGPVIVKYLQQNGFSMLLDNTGPPQQGGLNVLWAPGTDITEAIVTAYNSTTPGIAAPAPSAPSAARPAARPAAPKPAAPKQP
jgi:outer membrane protein